MGRMGNFNFRELKELQNKLNKLQDPDIFVESCAKELAKELWEHLIYNTPVQSGNLRRGWNIGEIEKTGDIYRIEIINPVKYASYVNYGHRQEVGRYVPAIGKKLKHGWVRGKFIIEKSEKELKRLTPEILQKEIKEYLKALM